MRELLPAAESHTSPCLGTDLHIDADPGLRASSSGLVADPPDLGFGQHTQRRIGDLLDGLLDLLCISEVLAEARHIDWAFAILLGSETELLDQVRHDLVAYQPVAVA
jgi:hypothetical protein